MFVGVPSHYSTSGVTWTPIAVTGCDTGCTGAGFVALAQAWLWHWHHQYSPLSWNMYVNKCPTCRVSGFSSDFMMSCWTCSWGPGCVCLLKFQQMAFAVTLTALALAMWLLAQIGCGTDCGTVNIAQPRWCDMAIGNTPHPVCAFDSCHILEKSYLARGIKCLIKFLRSCSHRGLQLTRNSKKIALAVTLVASEQWLWLAMALALAMWKCAHSWVKVPSKMVYFWSSFALVVITVCAGAWPKLIGGL